MTLKDKFTPKSELFLDSSVLMDDIYASSCFKHAMKMHSFMQLSHTSVMDGGAILGDFSDESLCN